MCLTKVNFALEFDKNLKEYVGRGFKCLERDYKNFDKWDIATGHYNSLASANRNGIPRDNAYDYIDYHAGFHIFLSEYAAYKYIYLNAYGMAHKYSTYEVSFTEVLAFGTNDAGCKNYPCIIARKMWVHGEPLRNINGKLEYNVK